MATKRHKKKAATRANTGLRPDQGSKVRFKGDVSLIAAGAAGACGTASLDLNDDAWGFKVKAKDTLSVGGHDREIQLFTIPQILASAGIDGLRIDLLKCDIEGSEEGLFGAPDAAVWLRLVRLLAIEVHEPYTMARLKVDLHNHGCDFDILDLVDNGPKSEAVLMLRPVMP